WNLSLRHCFVMSPKEFPKATNEGDDVFLCEYEYDGHWHVSKRLAKIDNGDEDDGGFDNDEEWNSNSRKGQIYGLQKIGSKKILEHVLDNVGCYFVLLDLITSLFVYAREMDDINAFVKRLICDDQCLVLRLYIHGVPDWQNHECPFGDEESKI
ncbi:hypothetical protein IFM89_021075, partial [Coptis chinensis]